MNAHNLQHFAPELRMFALRGRGTNSGLAITFDSLSPIDKTRATRTIQIPDDFGTLSFRLEGFTEPVDSADQRTLSGRIYLTTRAPSGSEEVSHELADCTFTFRAKGRASKHGVFNHVAPGEVAERVRQGVADALTNAVGSYYDSMAMPAPEVAMPQASSGAAAPVRPRLGRAANDDAQRSKRRMVAAMVGLPLIAVIVVLAVRNHSTSAVLNDAVASTMASDPQAVQAQVALTQETLKSMGLDPGAANDIGCLAQP